MINENLYFTNLGQNKPKVYKYAISKNNNLVLIDILSAIILLKYWRKMAWSVQWIGGEIAGEVWLYVLIMYF